MLGTKQIVLKSFGNKKPARISYGKVDTQFGDIILGFLTDANNAICYLHFAKDEDKENRTNNYEASLQKRFPNALLLEDMAQARNLTERIFSEEEMMLNVVVSGTPFQEAVWNELLKIPSGETCTYGDIANRIGKPNAVRAVGTAVGSNEISIVIPCHRVVSKNGDIKYGGGKTRKIHLLKYEYEKSLSGK